MKKRSFTLVELIITIAIIAVLAVTAFLVVTKWISKSRDSSRLQDIAVIQQGLETEIVNTKMYPMPDNYTGIYDTGNALAWYQGEFTDNVKNQIVSLSKLPKDPQGKNYGYSLSNDKKQYQLRAFLENTSYNDNYRDTANAATQVSKINGNYNGFLVTASGTIYTLWNIPTLFVWSGTGISSGANYVNENNKVSDNIISIKYADVSGLYDSNASNNSSTLDGIVTAFSGTNGVSTQALASLTMKTAAGGIGISQSSQATSPCNATTYTYSGHVYNITSSVSNGSSRQGLSDIFTGNNRGYQYSGTFLCNNGSFVYLNEIIVSQKQYMCVGNYQSPRLNKANPNICERHTACSKYWSCNGPEINCYLTTYADNDTVYTRTQGSGQFAGSTGNYGSTCGRLEMM